jgi:hypothetical protein
LKEDIDINNITKEKITSPCLIGDFILKSNSKRDVIHHMSLFPNEDILTKEIESWKDFANNLSSKEDRELFEMMLNDCYNYAAINAKGQPFPAEPLIMALLLSQHKMIDWLSKQISKYESPVNNNNVIKKSKEVEPVLERKFMRLYKKE